MNVRKCKVTKKQMEQIENYIQFITTHDDPCDGCANFCMEPKKCKRYQSYRETLDKIRPKGGLANKRGVWHYIYAKANLLKREEGLREAQKFLEMARESVEEVSSELEVVDDGAR